MQHPSHSKLTICRSFTPSVALLLEVIEGLVLGLEDLIQRILFSKGWNKTMFKMPSSAIRGRETWADPHTDIPRLEQGRRVDCEVISPGC